MGALANINEQLSNEVHNLLAYVERLRKELAGTILEEENKTPFESMSSTLDAIATSTLEASETILGASEEIANLSDSLREKLEDEEAIALCDQIAAKSMESMEACSFQDLTGQRVSKVIRSLQFVEERVDAMVALCGHDTIRQLSEEAAAQIPEPEDVQMHGPQAAGDAISQAEIDALFD